MKVSEFDYHLPPELIAQEPATPRDSSRLLVVHRRTGDLEHRSFREIGEFLASGDLLVTNDTRVIPARLIGERPGTGGRVEVFLLRQLDQNRWQTLVKPGRRLRRGSAVSFGGGLLTGRIVAEAPEGLREVEFTWKGDWHELLARLGQVPLPPYITAPLADAERYQTVYARAEGSVAAPTAGLHFTSELLATLAAQGITQAFLTLHVGLGTFRPVQVEEVEAHQMHEEYYEVTPAAAAAMNSAKARGGRLIAVGTTSCRTLETVAGGKGEIPAGTGWTNIFMYPGYRFKTVDALVTNFHLPKSTLLMLVSAFAGRDLIMRAYQEAIRERYRFYSFGDAMLIL